MVLESLLNPLKAEKEPWEMFFIGLAYSSLAILLSMWIFFHQTSLVMVFLTVMACVPIVYKTMVYEERKDLKIHSEKKLLIEHSKALMFLVMLFLGMMISFTAWYLFLPPATVSTVFELQESTIQQINNQVSGKAYANMSTLATILLNNIRVLAFAILFAFIYGSGAIFILTWNASVVGTALGGFIRENLASLAQLGGLSGAAGYFAISGLGLLRYLPHGIPEMAGYFIGGLAGGIISVAFIKKHYKSRAFSRIAFDVSELLIIALLFLIVAAYIEVFITPNLVSAASTLIS